MGTVEEGLEAIEKGFTGMDFGDDVDHVGGVAIAVIWVLWMG
jgi:hypothetical protein